LIIETSQDTIDFSPVIDMYHNGLKNWGIKLSGGADSAIVAYMLVKLIQEENLVDAKLYAITGIQDIKPYNERYSKSVINKIEELTGFKFSGHFLTEVRAGTASSYKGDQESLVQHLFSNGTINVRFSGITCNPTEEEAPHLWNEKNKRGAPADLELRTRKEKERTKFKDNVCRPLINLNKKAVAEIYQQLGVTDSLFPVTRSCESIHPERHKNYTEHCGKCWFCMEREWGFGRLI
jgi:hypothetical protein